MPEQQGQQQAPQQQLSEEQIKALQEKIKQMSPEELKEFQKKQCIFCQIISGKVQSKKIYEDEEVIAILDVNPANPGHLLIMPKEHYSIMPQMPEDEVGHIFLVAKALSNASLRALEVQGSNIIVANGVTAGQRAQHFMVHLIPRKDNDGVNFQVPQKTIPEEELKKISKLLSKSLGTKAEKAEITPIPKIPKQKIVEAEFKEKKKSNIKKDKGKKVTKNKETKEEIKPKVENKKTVQIKKEVEEKKVESKNEGKEGINLDDIARVLGTR
ncbi:MAG: HIT family protein [Nanoarchaeota archaeon]|nr:HIT family protein [Nanoarchaeota archaeon]